MIVPLALFAQLAGTCGPSVNVNTLAALARTESGFQSDAINDNTTGRRYALDHVSALALATDLVVVKRHSVDLGLMQVNSANLPRLGMSVADAFDPCKNVAAASRVLVAFYQAPPAGVDAQPALLRAISGYNTGNFAKGFTNGYVRRVQVSAAEIVPAIRLGGVMSADTSLAVPPAADQVPAGPPEPPEPPTWDVYARARAARQQLHHGASRRTAGPPLAAPGGASPTAPQPTAPQPAAPQPAAPPVQPRPVQLQVMGAAVVP